MNEVPSAAVRKRGTAQTMEQLAAERASGHSGEYRFDRKQATEMIRAAIENSEPITIIGDYDCDGVCASAILCMAIRSLGGNPRVRLPLRFKEGYGMRPCMIDEIERGLLITVDNGITAHEAAQLARERGLKLLLTDHHLPDREQGALKLPVSDCLIDPHVEELSPEGEGYDYAYYCGAGIALKIAEELLGPDADPVFLDKLYSLAAAATVADSVPLEEDNLQICRRGLQAMVQGNTTEGMKALLEESKVAPRDGAPMGIAPWMVITGENLGFKIGPAINAPSRLIDESLKGQEDGKYDYVNEGGDGAKISLVCLMAENPNAAKRLARKLLDYNNERKSVSDLGGKKARREIAEKHMEGDSPLVVYVPELKPGIVGNIAGSLCEEYGVPVILLSDGEEDMVHGSCRSPNGYHIREVLDGAADLLETYGGHAGAAGVSLRRGNIEAFRQRMQEIAGGFRVEKSQVPEYDIEIAVPEVNRCIRVLESMGPFGYGNPEPVILMRDVPVNQIDILQDGHIRLSRGPVNAIGFHLAERDGENGPYVLPEKARGSTVDLLGYLRYNCYRGRATVQFQISSFV